MIQTEFIFTDTEEVKVEHPHKCLSCGADTKVYCLEIVYCPECKQLYDYKEIVNAWVARVKQ